MINCIKKIQKYRLLNKRLRIKSKLSLCDRKLMATCVSSFKSNILCYIILAFCFLSLICFIGCYSTESVNITVRMDSKVDMRKYHSIAILNFFDKKSKPNEDQGKILARMIRKQLKNSKDFQVLDERNMDLDTDIHEDDIKDSSILASICNQLGVDALIVGEFEFSQRYQPVPYIVERYSSQTGKYVPEGRTYVQRTYSFLFHAQVVDGATGETIYDYSPRTEERPDYNSSGLGLLLDKTNDPANLRAIAAKSVTNFVLSLVPHSERERRILVK